LIDLSTLNGEEGQGRDAAAIAIAIAIAMDWVDMSECERAFSVFTDMDTG
jgi:hypothetical protein